MNRNYVISLFLCVAISLGVAFSIYHQEQMRSAPPFEGMWKFTMKGDADKRPFSGSLFFGAEPGSPASGGTYVAPADGDFEVLADDAASTTDATIGAYTVRPVTHGSVATGVFDGGHVTFALFWNDPDHLFVNVDFNNGYHIDGVATRGHVENYGGQ